MPATTTPSGESIDRYVAQISRRPLLTREAERALAERYRQQGDLTAAQELVASNLRFVVKIAYQYRGYGLGLLDLIQEGNIGLMIAVKKFDATRGHRLISYALWWIRAYMQSYIMHSWSLVKVGTTRAQRTLFFKLRSERARANREAGPGEVATALDLAKKLHVTAHELVDMEMRMSGRDLSLAVEVHRDARQTHVDRLVDPSVDQEETLGVAETRRALRRRVDDAMRTLNAKERYIVRHRLLCDEPKNLQAIGEHFCISRERARQIESNVMRKLKSVFKDSDLHAA